MNSGLFRSTDNGRTWERMNAENDRPFYYSQIRVDPRNPDRVYWPATNLRFSNDGGRTLRQVGGAIHVDYHAMWIDPTDPDHYWVAKTAAWPRPTTAAGTSTASTRWPSGSSTR